MAPKPKTSGGTLVFTGQKYSARFNGGKLIPLDTADRLEAISRLADLAAQRAAGAEQVRVQNGEETFATASERIVAALKRDGMLTADERSSRLLRYATPWLGNLPVREIRSGHISAVLAKAAEAGLAQQTVCHLHNDLRAVFRELVRDEVLEHNPARAEKVRVPRAARDGRKRTLLSDPEFGQFESAPTTAPQLRAMAWCSRGFGGMRTSDLHAWTWTDVDLEGWQWADVPRPKTEHGVRDVVRTRLVFPEAVRDVLTAWWVSAGRPQSGPVFPLPEGRSGKRKVPSYARALRRALWLAGVRRDALHQETPTSLPVDFHSFRRSFVTAVAASGENAQNAMRLVDHRSMNTHQRYNIPGALEIPAGAVPDAGGDWDAALADFDPTDPPANDLSERLVANGYGHSAKYRDPNGIWTRVTGVRDLQDPPAHIGISCQEGTEIPKWYELLTLFGSGPE